MTENHYLSVYDLLRFGVKGYRPEIFNLVCAIEQKNFLVVDRFNRIQVFDQNIKEHQQVLIDVLDSLAELVSVINKANRYPDLEDPIAGQYCPTLILNIAYDKYDVLNNIIWSEKDLPDFGNLNTPAIKVPVSEKVPGTKRIGTYNRLICTLASMANLSLTDGADDYEVIAKFIRTNKPLSGNLEGKRTIKDILDDAYQEKTIV